MIFMIECNGMIMPKEFDGYQIARLNHFMPEGDDGGLIILS